MIRSPTVADRGLLDTSVVIGLARGLDLEVPEAVAISTVTLCELHHGVLAADDQQRPGRLATLTAAERTFEALPVDPRVAPHFGELMASARLRGVRPAVADALIAATALSHGIEVLTRDRDFEAMNLPNLRIV